MTVVNASTKFRLVKTSARISPAMRVIAAVVLVCWSAALLACWHYCATRGCDRTAKVSAKSSCEVRCAKKQAGESPESKAPCGDSMCFTKKPLAAEKKIASPTQPSLRLAFIVASLSVAFELPAPSDVIATRQGAPRDWVFTPEVSLGPALRNLAPPVLI